MSSEIPSQPQQQIIVLYLYVLTMWLCLTCSTESAKSCVLATTQSSVKAQPGWPPTDCKTPRLEVVQSDVLCHIYVFPTSNTQSCLEEHLKSKTSNIWIVKQTISGIIQPSLTVFKKKTHHRLEKHFTLSALIQQASQLSRLGPFHHFRFHGPRARGADWRTRGGTDQGWRPEPRDGFFGVFSGYTDI